MTQKVVRKPQAENATHRIWLHVLILTLPIALLALYYISKDNTALMDWINAVITGPYRSAAAAVTSFGPFQYFSVAEILITVLVLWALFYVLRTIILLIREEHRLAHLGHRVFVLAAVGLYLFAAYSWIWGGLYSATDFSERSGLSADGITVQELTEVTALFAERANALSGEVLRDTDGHFNEDSDYYFALSKGVYSNLEKEFPELRSSSYPPKAMIYSKLMSAIGFTGVYIGLTGETNINVDAPGSLIPATIAHEMAHQRGISAEEEANFAGIAASVTSNITVYEYSGYLSGLMYLSDALYDADPDAWARISDTLNENVVRDWTDNSIYWSQYDTGAAEAVTAMYDSYLKQNGEALGVESYGACVDLLVTWAAEKNG
jgi:hypothetical protein